jgi:diguanylate cyclase (GGDEF)-like protein
MKLLVADDDPISRKLLQGCLSDAGYDVAVAANGAEALDMISKPGGPSLLVLDRTMPHVDGMDVCRAIRKRALEPDVYIILLTGRGEREDIVEGFEAGADDYMTKPFDIAELKARVRTGARIVERQTELIAAREQLRADAMYDPLTGLLNRAAFFDIFRKEVSRAERYETPLALIICSLDDFKETNETYGHLVGDIVLVEAARRLRASLRVSDSIGRYAGEEFAIVAPGCAANAGALLAERFRLEIASTPISTGNASLYVTMSFGVAAASDMKNAEDLLQAADDALYRAKTSGKNRVKGVDGATL